MLASIGRGFHVVAATLIVLTFNIMGGQFWFLLFGSFAMIIGVLFRVLSLLSLRDGEDGTPEHLIATFVSVIGVALLIWA